MKRRLFLNLVGGIALSLFAGCDQSGGGGTSGKTQSTSGTSAAPTTAVSASNAGGVIEIGMSQSNMAEPYRQQMVADIKAEEARHKDVIHVNYLDAGNDTLKQRSQVEELISKGVKLIIISPKEAQPLTEPVAKAMDAGIPVIVLDRKLIGDKYTCFIGGDNKAIGKAAGEWVKKTLGGKGNIVELKGLMTTVPAQDRHAGFVEGIAGSDIKTVFEADMQWLEPNARKEMESALARTNDFQLVFAHNDPGAHGAYLAAQAAGREKGVKFVGIDALPQEGVQYVKQGILDATFQYPTGGAQAIDAALKILKGESVSKEVTLSSRVFTKDNVDKGGEALP